MASGHHGILRGLQADLRDTILDLCGEGWSPSKTNGGHIRLVHPKAEVPVFISSTPSDIRTSHNLMRDCRKAMRATTALPVPPSLSEEDVTATFKSHNAQRRSKRRSAITGFPERIAAQMSEGYAKNGENAFPDKPKRKPRHKLRPAMPAPEPELTAEEAQQKDEPPMNMMSNKGLEAHLAGKVSEQDLKKKEGPVSEISTPDRADQQPEVGSGSGRTTSQTARSRNSRAKDKSPVSPGPKRAPRDWDPRSMEAGIEIGLKLARGELIEFLITPDMVGRSLILDRAPIFRGAAVSTLPESGVKAPAYRKNGKFNEEILDILGKFPKEEVPISMIADELVEKGYYKPRSARQGVKTRLAQMAEEGLVLFRTGPGEPAAQIKA